MRNAACLIALAAGLVLVALWLQPAASGQARPELAEKFTPGLRRTATIARKYTQTIETLAETEAVARQTQTITTSALVHEWYPTLDPQGRPARIVRTYRDLNRTLTTEDWAKGTEAVTAASDATPPWAGQVMTLEIVDGELRVTGGATAMNDYARASVVGDFETDLQPHRAKEVGKSWKIRGSGIEPLRDTSEAADYEDGLVTITLKSLDAVKATFEFSGTLKFRQKRADPDNPGQDVTNLLHESDLKGSAEFDVAAGRWLSRELTVESKLSGKRDGQAVQGTAILTDKRAFGWGKIIDTAPDNGLIEDAGDSAHRVCSKGRIPPDRFVVGVASEKRSAIVEFEPSTQKVTRTLVAFAPKVQYGNIALSPDRTKLAFASTLNNDLTLEPWNVFVLDLEAGKLNQITPKWASGDGLAKIEEAKETTTLDVHLQPLDKDIGGHGEVWIEGRTAPQAFGGKGFRNHIQLTNVPVGPVKVCVRGGASENWKSVAGDSRFAGHKETATTKDGSNQVAVPVLITTRQVGFRSVGWYDGGLISGGQSVWPTGSVQVVRRAGETDESTTFPIVTGEIKGLSYNPGAKLLAVMTERSEANQAHTQLFIVEAGQKEALSVSKPAVAGLQFGPCGDWAPDSRTWLAAGSILRPGINLPALLTVDPKAGTTTLSASWPELAERTVANVAYTVDGQSIGVVLQSAGGSGDLYLYHPTGNSMRRLTSLGDVTTIANVGR